MTEVYEIERGTEDRQEMDLFGKKPYGREYLAKARTQNKHTQYLSMYFLPVDLFFVTCVLK
jgi:hypothetical protein